MSGPEEVEVLVRLISDGVREKMLRPKCLARSHWLHDAYDALGMRVSDEMEETRVELLTLYDEHADAADPIAVEARAARWAVRVFRETCDVAAFGAMLADKASGRRVA